MPGLIADEKIDATDSREIMRGIGEKLRQSLGAEQSVPDRLQQLLDALRERELLDAARDKRG